MEPRKYLAILLLIITFRKILDFVFPDLVRANNDMGNVKGIWCFYNKQTILIHILSALSTNRDNGNYIMSKEGNITRGCIYWWWIHKYFVFKLQLSSPTTFDMLYRIKKKCKIPWLIVSKLVFFILRPQRTVSTFNKFICRCTLQLLRAWWGIIIEVLNVNAMIFFFLIGNNDLPHSNERT